MRLESCAEILVRPEPGPHHPFVCINRVLFGSGRRARTSIQIVKGFIDGSQQAASSAGTE
jgi:hypothetical protein